MLCAIFDIDGVLADSWWRRHHIQGRSPDWPAFFEDCPSDPPLTLVALPPLLVSLGWEIVYVTSRPEWNRTKTLGWLRAHIPADHHLLIMKPPELEGRGGDTWKMAEIERLCSVREVGFIFEDSPSVIAGLRAKRLPVVPILSGYYEWRVRG